MVGRMIRNKSECEEICMDVFLKVHQKLGDFNFQSKLSTWIGAIAYRLSLNHLRKNQILSDDFASEEILTLANHDMNPEKIYSRKELKEYVHRLVQQLPPFYSVVITLYHLEEKNYKEIEEITGFPEGTVKSYLFRGRKLLKEKLENLKITDEI